MHNLSRKSVLFTILFILLGGLLVACGGTEEATAIPNPTGPPADVLPTTAVVEPEATATTASLPEPTVTAPANDSGDSYPAPTLPPPPANDGAYPAVPPTVAPLTDGAYPGPEGIPEEGMTLNVLSFGPEGEAEMVIEGTEITAVFTTTQISGIAGCNNYNATLTLSENFFTVGPIISTEMACSEPEGVIEQEQAYLTALQGVTAYNWQWRTNDTTRIVGGQLLYTLEDGSSGIINLIATEE